MNNKFVPQIGCSGRGVCLLDQYSESRYNNRRTNHTETRRMNSRGNEGRRRSIRGARATRVSRWNSFSPLATTLGCVCTVGIVGEGDEWIHKMSPSRPIESTIILTRWRGYFTLFHGGRTTSTRKGSGSHVFSNAGEVRKILAIKGRHAVLSSALDAWYPIATANCRV